MKTKDGLLHVEDSHRVTLVAEWAQVAPEQALAILENDWILQGRQGWDFWLHYDSQQHWINHAPLEEVVRYVAEIATNGYPPL